MQIDIFVVHKDNIRTIIDSYLKRYGVPTIRRDLSVYFDTDRENKHIHIRFRNKRCQVFYIDPETDSEFRPKLFLDSKTSIKSLFTFTKKLNFNSASIGVATSFSFYNEPDVFVELMINTFIGDFIHIGYTDKNHAKESLDFAKSLGMEVLDNTAKRKIIDGQRIQHYRVIDDAHVVNNIIYNYAKDTGLSFDSNESTLTTKIQCFNNDYSFIEEGYDLIFGENFLSNHSLSKKYHALFKPVSIIIPSYNSNKSILKVLDAIESQNLPKKYLKQLDVIIIDDGSTTPVMPVIKNSKHNYSFEYCILRVDPQSGLSNARNVGIAKAKHDILCFIDSDIVLDKNYILEHSIRNQFVPNAIFVSFKSNLDQDDPLLSYENIAKGLDKPNINKDSRVRKIIEDDALGLYEISGKTAVEILSSTNYFKDFSYGRTFGVYDLSTMVVGHNMTSRKELVEEVGGFSNKFLGWGLEDTFFGARMIANGNFVIPVISTGVYHIDHPPRSGSIDKKTTEFKENLTRYKLLIQEPYTNILELVDEI